MAIDTRDKRGSCLGLNDIVLPNPDGTIDTADRLHAGYSYRGIAAGAVGTTNLLLITSHASMRRTFTLTFGRVN